MIESSGTAGRRTQDSVRLVHAGVALAVLVTLGLAAAAPQRSIVLIGVSVALAVVFFTVKRPVAVGLPLLVVVIFSNASDLLTRLFGIPSILQALFAVLLAVIVLQVERFRPFDTIRHPISLLLALFLSILFISTLWATTPALVDERVSETGRALLLFVIVATLAGSSRAAYRTGLAAVAAAAAILASLSVYQVATGHYEQQFGRFAAVQFGHIFGQVAEARVAGPLDDPNFYAQILLLALPVTLALALTSSSRTRQFVWLIAAAVVGSGVLLTYSRGAILALGVVVMLLPLAVPARRVLRPALAIAVTAILIIGTTDLGRRVATLGATLEPSGVERDSSLEKRKLLLGAAWMMFLDHPAGGVGAGNFDENYRQYASYVGSAAPQYDDPGEEQFPHSLPAELAAETGVLGLATFAAVLIGALLSCLAGIRRFSDRGFEASAALLTAVGLSLAGYLVTALFLHSAYQRYFWLFLAFTVAGSLVSQREAVANSDEVTA